MDSSACLEAILTRFEEAWKRGERPRVEDYLPPDQTSRHRLLVELAHTELEYRLRRDDTVGVEDYWRRFPELREAGAALDLIAAEYELRRERGAASLGDYLLRFPQYADDLRRRLARRPEVESPSGPGRTVGEGDAVEAPAPAEGDRLGKFEVLAAVGRGSFGVVYRARDTELGRVVALKVPRAGCLSDRRARERFLREAHSAARLSHPGIIPVYEAGQAGGVCYLVSEFVYGPTLARHLAAGRLAARRCAELAAQIARALQHAHERGVVHRDLKPANILLQGERLQPRITDFGLARAGQEQATLTATAELLGTPAYMSPEQARGEGRTADARSDVYSLGVILYEMLTGELPFRGSNAGVLRQVLEEEPRPPRRLNEAVPRDLETVCLRAMAKEPRHRYSSAAELADDLERFLAGRPVGARPVGWAGRLARWARRKPVVAGLTAALLLVAVAGFAGVLAAWRQAVVERGRAEASRAEAQRRHDQARDDFRQAHQALTELLDHALRASGEDGGLHEALDKSLGYYQGFLRQHEDDPHLAVETAWAHMRVGDILHARGDLGAPEAYERAGAHWERLLDGRPDERVFRANLVRCLLFRGHALHAGGPETARACCRRARPHAETLVADWPDDGEFRVLLASVHYDLGCFADPQTPPAEVLAEFRQAQAEAERLVRQAPSVPEYRVLLGETVYRVATALRESGRRAEARELYRQGVAMWDELTRSRPPGGVRAGHSYWYSGFYQTGHQPLSRAWPSQEVSRSYLAQNAFWLGAMLDRAGRPREALDSFRRAADEFRRLADRQPAVTSYRRDLAASHHCLGNLHREAGRLEEAVTSYRAALALRAQLAREAPKDARFRSDLEGTRVKLSLTLTLLGRLSEARAVSRADGG